MQTPFSLPSNGFGQGYVDDDSTIELGALAPPSKNVRISLTATAESRMGYEDTLWSLGQAGHPARSHYMTEYNITFFSINGKVLYIEHDRSNTVVDTGLSLTATETTNFGEYAGDIFTINQTDGIRQIHVMRLNDAAATVGDPNVTVDQNGGGRLNAFGETASTLRIQGTNEAYTACTTAGLITTTAPLSATYANKAIAIVIKDISSTTPKGNKIGFWKDRMVVIGVTSDTTTDNANQIAYMSQFASARNIQKVIVFGNTGGASEEWIGKGGSLTSLVTTRDYLYYFKNDEVYYSSVSDVNTSTGATSPQLLSTNYGAVNGDCACDLGSGLVVFLTKNKRIVGIRISTKSGAPTVFPDETFDQAIRNTLDYLDTDQSKARMFYHKAKRLLYVQVSVQNVIKTLVFDNNIGVWLPPDDNKQFNDFFEKDGILYATDLYDQTIYEMDRGTTDNGLELECVMAHGKFPYLFLRRGKWIKIGGTCEWKNIEMRGSIGRGAVINIETRVDGGSTAPKTINASDYSFSGVNSIGDEVIGNEVLGNQTQDIPLADWATLTRIAPTSYGLLYQTILSSTSYFEWVHFKIEGSNLASPLTTQK